MSTAQLALGRGKGTRSVTDLCQGGRIRVVLSPWEFNTANRMKEGDLQESIIYSYASTHEILATFFDEHKITPTFIDDKNTYSEYDEEAGEWTGAVAMVSI